MELVSSERNSLKFYQRISFWMVFFILLGTCTSLIIHFGIFKYNLNLFLKYSAHGGTVFYIVQIILLQPLGILGVLSEYFVWYIPDTIYYILEIIVWLKIWIIIILLRKKKFFRIITFFIIGWFVLSTASLLFSFWWNENWHNRVDFGA